MLEFCSGGSESSSRRPSHLSKDIREVLEDGGVPTKSIDAIVWSHWHIDYIGDPSLFDTSVKLVVGPGFNEHILPPYPPNENSVVLQSDFEGRELEELDFSQDTLKSGVSMPLIISVIALFTCSMLLVTLSDILPRSPGSSQNRIVLF